MHTQVAAEEAEAEAAAADRLVAASGAGARRACRLLVEARLGKRVARLRDWVSSHRKAQRAAKKGTAAVVKGAKEVWYRRDAAGYLWLSLRWQPAAVEQYPGAAPPNFTYAASHLLAAGGGWEVEGEPVDSRGRSRGDAQTGHVLSTM